MGIPAPDEERVSIGARMSDRGSPQRTAAATLIFDHDRAQQRLHLVGPRTTDRIVRAAGRKRNYKSDRTVGVFRLSKGGTRTSGPPRQSGEADRNVPARQHNRASEHPWR